MYDMIGTLPSLLPVSRPLACLHSRVHTHTRTHARGTVVRSVLLGVFLDSTHDVLHTKTMCVRLLQPDDVCTTLAASVYARALHMARLYYCWCITRASVDWLCAPSWCGGAVMENQETYDADEYETLAPHASPFQYALVSNPYASASCVSLPVCLG